jgi:hypothetical protein
MAVTNKKIAEVNVTTDKIKNFNSIVKLNSKTVFNRKIELNNMTERNNMAGLN